MRLNIKNQVARLSPKTDYFSVLLEALTNAIHAGAANIKVELDLDGAILEGSDSPKEVVEITVVDDGEGFTEENLRSFGEYRSDLKAALGCKGVGRLSFLKVFNRVSVESVTSDRKVCFDFDYEFDDAIVKPTFEVNKTTGTTLTLGDPRLKDGNVPTINVEVLVAMVRLHLMPLLYLRRKTSEIKITFSGVSGEVFDSISTADMPNFESENFELDGGHEVGSHTSKFNLFYHIEEVVGEGSSQGYYVANNLSVCTFSSKEFPVSRRKGFNIVMLLTSPYFDDRVNDGRDDFAIYPVRSDLLAPLSWEFINRKLQSVLVGIFRNRFSELKAEQEEFITKVSDDNLHLADYLEVNPLSGNEGIATAVRKAKDRYEKDKGLFLKQMEDGEVSPEEALRKASQFSGRELIEYVQMRDRVIAELEKLVGDKEKCEAVIHDLILNMGESGGAINPMNNNLWLIDDRFMGFSYAASDKQIRVILDAVEKDNKGGYDSLKEPDFCVFFRNEEGNHNGVVVELKPFDQDAKKKHRGLYQLREYVSEFKKSRSLEQVWYYLITDVDEDFSEKLKEDDFQPLFSTKERVWYRYYRAQGIYIYVLPAVSLISDARARNKTFIDLAKRNLTPEF